MIESFSCDGTERVKHKRKNYSARDQTMDSVSQWGEEKQEQEIRLKNGIVLFKKTLPEYKHKFKSN